jgi:5'(3')-deoxyribonucleotidase
MIICVDIDNTLNDLVYKTLKLYNSRTSKDIQMSDITGYNFYDCLPKEDADGIFELFKEKELWDSLEPLPHSQKVLRTLANQGHRIIAATATDPINFSWKVDWMSKHFPFIPTDNIIRIMDKSLLRVDVLIEDCMDNLISNVCERIIIDYPWNQSTSKDYAYNIARVDSWEDIPSVIKDIEGAWKEWEKR